MASQKFKKPNRIQKFPYIINTKEIKTKKIKIISNHRTLLTGFDSDGADIDLTPRAVTKTCPGTCVHINLPGKSALGV